MAIGYRIVGWSLFGLMLLGACGPLVPTPAPTPTPPITLLFTYWGSATEQAAVQEMVAAFEAAHPGIHITPQHFEAEVYMNRVEALVNSGQGPDIGYLVDGQALAWGAAGKVKDLTDEFETDPALRGRLPETFYYFTPDQHTLGTNTAVEIVSLFYNTALFDQAGLAYPPAVADEAWDWDEFVAVARQLTVDEQGAHPGDPNFDPNAVRVYGVRFATEHWAWADYYPFIYSNGAEIVNEAGTQLTLNTPEAREAIQRLHDLMWVEHVMPPPAEPALTPSADVDFQLGQVAMVIGGHWKMLDYAGMDGLAYDVAVLPKMKTPKTVLLGSPTVIFAGTSHYAAALEFYKFHNDPQQVDLFARGLWMPAQEAYYTDPLKQAQWLVAPAHSARAPAAVADYTLCCAVRTPHYYVKNFDAISGIIQRALNHVWDDTWTVEAATQWAVTEAEPLLEGRWDR